MFSISWAFFVFALLLIALVLTLAGGLSLLGILPLGKRSQSRVNATVVDVKRKGDERTGYTYHPVVEFLFNGKIHRVDHETHSCDLHDKGEGLTVCVPHDDPQGAQLGQRERWGIATALLLVGSATSVTGIVELLMWMGCA